MEIVSSYPINESVLVEFREILKDYDILISKRFIKDNEKEFLEDSNNQCRFCGKSHPEVLFKKVAHAIPEFIGNKCLISKFECDTCNQLFSKFENEMANYMLPHNVMSGTRSKGNKTAKYKQAGQPQINYGDEYINISDVPESMLNNVHNPTLQVKRPSYIPEFVYRCMIKIGMSIVPEEKLYMYSGTLGWLRNLDIQSNLKPGMVLTMYPFNLKSDEISCIILNRKDECVKNVPQSIFFLSYNNFAFQTFIPYTQNEKTGVALQVVPFVFPTSFDLNKDYDGQATYSYIDLSSRSKLKNQIVTYTITGEGYINE